MLNDLHTYPLYPYLRYEYLRPRLGQVDPDEIHNFLEDYPDIPITPILRSKWLLRLARNGDWQSYIDVYQPQQHTVLRCYQLQARIETGVMEGVLTDAKELWLVGESQPKECDPAFALLEKSPHMTNEFRWERFRLAMANGNTRLAAFLARKLDKVDKTWATHWLSMRKDPMRMMRHPELKGDQPIAHEILADGIRRLATRDLGKAHAEWLKIKVTHDFDQGSIAAVERDLALIATKQRHLQAIAWLDGIPAELVDARVQRARLQAALYTQDWGSLSRWTEQEAATDMNPARWRYWRARALENTAQRDAATQVYRQLAGERDYYGFIAADRLGMDYRIQDQPTAIDPIREAEVLAYPGIVRARELYHVGMIPDGRREWHHAIKQMDEMQLQHAAVLAHNWGWHSRAILSVAQARAYDDLALRFPMPYRDAVMTYADKRHIEPAFLYSIIRSESAFMSDARSGAGALGLMQLMPKTGRYIAKRIGYKLKSSRALNDDRTNITLGSAYLRHMLDQFNDNIAMAAAAYNAGPHRVRSWLPKSDCMSADVWIDLIPFTETRRYVRRALFYSALYEWRMAQRVTPIETRLASIPPKQTGKHESADCNIKAARVAR